MPTKIVIKNGDILTLNEDNDLIVRGTLVIENELISSVHEGPPEGNELIGATQVIDATNQIVMPGLVDLHYHTGVSKGWKDYLPLKEYLMECGYPWTAALTGDWAYKCSAVSYIDSIKCGTTCVNNMHTKIEYGGKAAADVGMRCFISNTTASDEYGLDTLEDVREGFKKIHNAGNGLVKVLVGIEWIPVADKELLVNARKLADELGIGIHIHLNESAVEVKEVTEKFGIPPTKLAYGCGILGPDCVAAHCVHLNDEEIQLMAKTGTHISHNPSSNAKLGNGIARLPEYLKAGINVGLGHDAVECNNSRDLFEVLKFASLMHKANRQDESLGRPGDILKLCCIGGNKALGLNGGILAPGKTADVITLGINNTMFTPICRGNVEQYYSHIVYAANGSVVENSIINGKVVMFEKKILTYNEQQAIDDANYVFSELMKI